MSSLRFRNTVEELEADEVDNSSNENNVSGTNSRPTSATGSNVITSDADRAGSSSMVDSSSRYSPTSVVVAASDSPAPMLSPADFARGSTVKSADGRSVNGGRSSRSDASRGSRSRSMSRTSVGKN